MDLLRSPFAFVVAVGDWQINEKIKENDFNQSLQNQPANFQPPTANYFPPED
jgi:hypothetical protein